MRTAPTQGTASEQPAGTANSSEPHSKFDELLPDVITHKIFPLLGMQRLMLAAAVCSTWRTCSRRTLALWHSLDLERVAALEGGPCFLATLPNGDIITTEATVGVACLRIMSPSLVQKERLGSRAATPSGLQLLRPTGVAVDATDQRIFVACSEGAALWCYDMTCQPPQAAVSSVSIADATGAVRSNGPNGPLRPFRDWEPYGLAIATTPRGARLLFVADSRWHRVLALERSDRQGGMASDGGAAGHATPYALHASWGEHGDACGAFDHPRGLGIQYSHSDGSAGGAPLVWVCDRGNDRLQCFTVDGQFVRQLGSSGTAPGKLLGPYALAFAAGRLIVSEFEGRRVQVLSNDGAPLQLLRLADTENACIGGYPYPGARCALDPYPCPTGVAAFDDRVYVAQFTGMARLHVYQVSDRAAPTREQAPPQTEEEDDKALAEEHADAEDAELMAMLRVA